jgi:adenosine deaminase
MKKFTNEYLKEIPKTDLHLHLDGSLRVSSLIEMAKKQKIELPSFSEEGLRKLVFKDAYNNLGEYLHGFMYTCAVLRDSENLERAAYELAIDNQNEGVYYIEVRYAPQLLMDNGKMDMVEAIDAVNRGLKKAEVEFNQKKEVKAGLIPEFHYGIIACAMRMFGPQFSPYYGTLYQTLKYSKAYEVMRIGALELAQAVIEIRDQKGIPIVGFDLAGQEDGYPAENFKDAYDYVHRNFMHKSVHAGEAYGAESIFQAISDLHADRLGHAYYLFDDKKISDPKITNKTDYIQKLSSFVAEKRVTVEVCLTSNMQTNPEIKDIKNHSFKKMLDNKISTTICTDNRLVSNTTVTKEYELAVNNFSIELKQLQDIVAYGFKRSFYPGAYSEKRKYVRSILNYFDSVTKKHIG